MDDITRDLPADAGSSRSRSERIKGPEELVLLARGVAAEDLVVSDSRIPDEVPPEGAAAPSSPEGVVPPPEGLLPPPVAEEAMPDDSTALEPIDGEPGESADAVDAAAAAAAVAAEADTVEIDESSVGDGSEDLPPVPELTDAAAASKIVFVLMLTQREGLSLLRLAQACNTTQKLIEQALGILQQDLQAQALPLELARTGDTVRLLSSAPAFPYLTRLRGVKKMEKLSPAALETLAVIAYKQPVMRAEIESIRGVKAGPMLRTLLQHKLIRVTGRADVPGRPLQYGTSQLFLERFGLSSLQDLPSQREFKAIQ